MPAGWSAPSTTGANAGYSTVELRHTRRRRADDHRLVADDRGRLDLHDHLRLDCRRRARRDRDLVHRCADLAGPGEVHRRAARSRISQLSPSITVNAADGSGTLTTGHHGLGEPDRPHHHLHLHRPAGGINNGTVTVVVPAGWSAPSTTGANAGYTTASSGTVWVAAQTITVSSLTLAAGNTATITYGNTGSGGPGATATSSTGAQTWQAQEKSTSGRLAHEPRRLAEHHRLRRRRLRTLTTPTTTVSASQTGRTITFTYTAPPAGSTTVGNARRPGRLERTVDDRSQRRLLHLERRHPHRLQPDDHRCVADARGGEHVHDHVRGHR